LPNFIKTVKRLQKYGDLTGFPKWRPSAIWISWARISTTHDDYSVVSIVVQNLVEIDEVSIV